MKRKRSFEYTDAEKKEIIEKYQSSGLDADTFIEQTGISGEILEFWLRTFKASDKKEIYLSLFYDSADMVKGVYTEKSYFDKMHLPNEQTNPYIADIMDTFFTDNILNQEYYNTLDLTDPETPHYDATTRIQKMITNAGIDVTMEQSIFSSEFFNKASMYLENPDLKNFIPPLKAVPEQCNFPVKSTYMRLKPNHDWLRPNYRHNYVNVLCVDKELFDTTGQIQPDKTLEERLSIVLDGFELREEFTPRHYKDYTEATLFWGDSIMDYHDVNITDYMQNYISALLQTINITAITDNETLNARFIINTPEEQ